MRRRIAFVSVAAIVWGALASAKGDFSAVEVTASKVAGSVWMLKSLEAYRKMLLASTQSVKDALAKGATLEEIQAAGLPAELASWGEGPVDTKAWLFLVHESVTRNAAKP